MRRGVMVAAATLVAVAAGSVPGASASGGGEVVVKGLSFPDLSKSRLNVVGCAGIFDRSGQAPQAWIGGVPGGPAGKRSLALTTAPGDAAGPVSYVASLSANPIAEVSVYSASGTTGVGYVGYQAPADVGTNRMWVGRVDLGIAGGAWARIGLAGRTFSWTPYDMSSRQPLGSPAPPTDLATFMAAQGGDGYGFYAVGFGCDGREFNTDAWEIGPQGATTTYNFERYDATVSGGADSTIVAGDETTLTADASADGGAAPRVVLEAQRPDGGWGVVDTRQGTHVSLKVSPAATTTYRWKVYSTPMVEGAQSDPFTVTVRDPEPEPTPSEEPSESADPQPAQESKQAPEKAASDAPAPAEASTPAPAEASTPAPAEPPAEAPVETPVEAPAGSAAGEPTPSATVTETPAG